MNLSSIPCENEGARTLYPIFSLFIDLYMLIKHLLLVLLLLVSVPFILLTIIIIGCYKIMEIEEGES